MKSEKWFSRAAECSRYLCGSLIASSRQRRRADVVGMQKPMSFLADFANMDRCGPAASTR